HAGARGAGALWTTDEEGGRGRARQGGFDRSRAHLRTSSRQARSGRSRVARRSQAKPGVFPAEFEDLLSRAGKRVLAGTHPLCGALADPKRRFLAADDLIDRAKAARLRRTLEVEL